MEVNRIGGGFEYRPEIMTLVLPGDRDYRVRTARTSVSKIVPSARATTESPIYIRMEMSTEGRTLANQNGLNLLRQLGDMEAERIILSYSGMDIVDEFAGGHRGIIDIRV
jgi:hypothetical protein